MSRASPQVGTREARDRMLQADPAFFASEVLGIELGDHHLEWADLARQEKRVSVLAARGHGKSGFWSYAYPLWQTWRRPNNYGLIFSDTESQVGEFFRIIKEGKEFVDDDGHRWRLPAVVDVDELAWLLPRDWSRAWTESKLSFANGGLIIGRTFGARSRGRHVRWIVVDDPLGDDAAYSELARQKDADFFARVVSPMLLPGGQIVVVGTPLHADDLHARLGRNPEYVQRRYPALVTEPETGTRRPLWPEFRPLAWIEAKEREIGSLAFGQEYMLQPATSEASLFPPRLFHARPETMDYGRTLGPPLAEIRTLGWSVFMGVDVAMSAEVGADFFWIVTIGVDDLGNRWLLDLEWSKGLPFQAQLGRIKDAAARYEPDLIFIEANAAQRIYGDELIRGTDLPIGKFVTSAAGKNSLDSGVPGLRTLIENGKIRIPRGSADSVARTDRLINELMAFAWVNDKLQGVGEHDDGVMALWLCDQAIRASRRFTAWTATPDGIEEDAPLAGPAEHPALTVARETRRLTVYGEAVPADDRRGTAEVAMAQAGGGDLACAVAADLPLDRGVWIGAWNALMGGAPLPGAVASAVARHGEPAVRDALRGLLGMP